MQLTSSFVRLGLLLAAAAASGCAVAPAPVDMSRAAVMHVPVHDSVRFAAGPNALGDEIRLIDTRVIRQLMRSDLPAGAVFLTRPQKVAIIAGATVVAVWLISDWIEDNVAFFP